MIYIMVAFNIGFTIVSVYFQFKIANMIRVINEKINFLKEIKQNDHNAQS